MANHSFSTPIFSKGAAVCAALLVCISGLALAEDPAPAAAPAAKSDSEHCIPLNQIRRTRVLDDQNILFYTSNTKAYLNRLPHRCSGLGFSESFEYKTSQSELCSLDIITVLNRIGGGFMQGPSCGLGQFEPVDPKAVEAEFKAKKAAKN